jgi:glyoxylase-like metal-dependent hydrolase (beta-lactamase superfamily II)
MVPSLFFLLEQPGRQVLVDTSFGDQAGAEQLELVVKREDCIKKILSDVGIWSEKVEVLLLTHTTGIMRITLASLLTKKNSARKRSMPMPLKMPAPPSEKPCGTRDKDSFSSGGDGTLLLGIRAIYSGGHTSGSQMLQVDTHKGMVPIPRDEIK